MCSNSNLGGNFIYETIKTNYNGTPTTSGYPASYVEKTGLKQKPKMIIVSSGKNSLYHTFWAENMDYIQWVGGYSREYHDLSNSTFYYINNTGFRIPFGGSGENGINVMVMYVY